MSLYMSSLMNGGVGLSVWYWTMTCLAMLWNTDVHTGKSGSAQAFSSSWKDLIFGSGNSSWDCIDVVYHVRAQRQSSLTNFHTFSHAGLFSMERVWFISHPLALYPSGNALWRVCSPHDPIFSRDLFTLTSSDWRKSKNTAYANVYHVILVMFMVSGHTVPHYILN